MKDELVNRMEMKRGKDTIDDLRGDVVVGVSREVVDEVQRQVGLQERHPLRHPCNN